MTPLVRSADGGLPVSRADRVCGQHRVHEGDRDRGPVPPPGLSWGVYECVGTGARSLLAGVWAVSTCTAYFALQQLSVELTCAFSHTADGQLAAAKYVHVYTYARYRSMGSSARFERSLTTRMGWSNILSGNR